MDKDKRYWKYGLLIYIVANYVGYLGDYLKLIVYVLLILTLLMYLMNLVKNGTLSITASVPIKDESRTLGIITITSIIIGVIDLAVELYIKMFYSKYEVLFQNRTIDTIEKVYALLIVVLFFLFAYKQADENRKYIVLKAIKFMLIVSIIASIMFLLAHYIR